MVEIRQATSKDLEQLTNWTLAIHFHEDDNSIPPHPELKQRLSKWLHSELVDNNGLFLIAEVECLSVGFIYANSVINDNGFLASPIKGVIHLLWVDENYRCQKIAEKLTESIEACFKELAISYIECSFTDSNELAKLFWISQGFTPHSVTARKLL